VRKKKGEIGDYQRQKNDYKIRQGPLGVAKPSRRGEKKKSCLEDKQQTNWKKTEKKKTRVREIEPEKVGQNELLNPGKKRRGGKISNGGRIGTFTTFIQLNTRWGEGDIQKRDGVKTEKKGKSYFGKEGKKLQIQIPTSWGTKRIGGRKTKSKKVPKRTWKAFFEKVGADSWGGVFGHKKRERRNDHRWGKKKNQTLRPKKKNPECVFHLKERDLARHEEGRKVKKIDKGEKVVERNARNHFSKKIKEAWKGLSWDGTKGNAHHKKKKDERPPGQKMPKFALRKGGTSISKQKKKKTREGKEEE